MQFKYKNNINVCKFVDGVKVDKNPKNENVIPSDVERLYNNEGCTIQILHPQHYNDTIWKINECLEQYFTCLVGSNCYLTPKNAQGLAPHNDDIDVFALQLEGKKKWKLYEPLDYLAREHSGDYSHDEIGDCTYEFDMEEGDLLYFPRGYIHEALTSDTHSLHLTVSTYQKNTWGDFIQKNVNNAIENLFNEDPEFRKGLPVGYLNYVGTVESGSEKLRKEFLLKHDQLYSKFLEAVATPLENADDMSDDFMTNRLPPYSKSDSKKQKNNNNNKSSGIQNNSMVKLEVSYLRLMISQVEKAESDDDEDDEDEEEEEEDDDEDDDEMETCIIISFSTENNRETHLDGRVEPEPNTLQFPLECLDDLTKMMKAYPKGVKVSDLKGDKKMELLECLKEAQLLTVLN